MKSEEQIDAIMAAIPENWRRRWCGGERGACACLGCVQIGNRAVIAEGITGKPYGGDPEYLDEAKLQEHGSVYGDLKLSREEWDSWISRHPAAPNEASGGIVMFVGKPRGANCIETKG
ncbi:TPA: hypothetical protein ACYLN4_000643 [Burkholderia lata]